MSTPDEQTLMIKIAHRAIKDDRSLVFDSVMQVVLDLEAVHKEIQLDLEALLNADPIQFSHDIYGIRRHLDRRTGKVRDHFVPRFAKRNAP